MKHDAGHTAHQQQSSVHTPLDGQEHASKTASHLEADADEASGSSVDIPAAADSLPGSTSTETSGSSSSAAAVTSHAPSSSSSSHSSTAPGAGRSQQDVAKVLVPAAVLLAAALWLLRKARSNSTSSKKQASKHKQRQRQQADQQEAAAAAAAEEAVEPDSTLALYASDFQLRTEDVTLVSRPAALQGLTCVISEHIPIQVNPGLIEVQQRGIASQPLPPHALCGRGGGEGQSHSFEQCTELRVLRVIVGAAVCAFQAEAQCGPTS